MSDPDDKKRSDTSPGKAKNLIGRGQNVSVRSVQLAGFARPGGAAGATAQSAIRQAETQRLKQLATVEDWRAYLPKPAEMILLKELDKQKPEALQRRVAHLSAAERQTLANVAGKILGSTSTLPARLRDEPPPAPTADDDWLK